MNTETIKEGYYLAELLEEQVKRFRKTDCTLIHSKFKILNSEIKNLIVWNTKISEEREPEATGRIGEEFLVKVVSRKGSPSYKDGKDFNEVKSFTEKEPKTDHLKLENLEIKNER